MLGRCICVRVEVDMSKPLERGFFVNLRGPKPVMIYIMYKRLPNYCYDCGWLGHTRKECPNEPPNQDYTLNLEAKYADWVEGLPTQTEPEKVIIPVHQSKLLGICSRHKSHTFFHKRK